MKKWLQNSDLARHSSPAAVLYEAGYITCKYLYVKTLGLQLIHQDSGVVKGDGGLCKIFMFTLL